MLAQKTIMVIDPATTRPELNCLNLIIKLSELPCTFHLPALYSANSFAQETPSSWAGVIILGSRANVNENLEWQKDLTNILEIACSQNTPILGICYGHQLLAHFYGAAVSHRPPEAVKARGVREISFAENPLWGSAHQRNLIVSHRDEVLECPKEFIVTAKSQHCAIEGMAHAKKPIFGFQSHPEATSNFLEGGEQPVYLSPETLNLSTTQGHDLIRKFLKLCRFKAN